MHFIAKAGCRCFPFAVPKEGARLFLQAVRDLNRDLSIPKALPVIRPEDIPLLARRASKEAGPLYPAPKLMGARGLETFYRQAAQGENP